jgi:hypothetical protein
MIYSNPVENYWRYSGRTTAQAAPLTALQPEKYTACSPRYLKLNSFNRPNAGIPGAPAKNYGAFWAGNKQGEFF